MEGPPRSGHYCLAMGPGSVAWMLESFQRLRGWLAPAFEAHALNLANRLHTRSLRVNNLIKNPNSGTYRNAAGVKKFQGTDRLKETQQKP